MLHTAAEHTVDTILAEHRTPLGADLQMYRNHVLRVLTLSDALWNRLRTAQRTTRQRPSTDGDFLIAATFHDLGIWTEGTFDYLQPSIQLATDFIRGGTECNDRELVASMIAQHHKVRTAAEPANPIELLRRADAIDVSLGFVRHGIPPRTYRDCARTYPSLGFHRKLLKLTVRRSLGHPASPLPMLRW
ncbi:HD domain-containing protein [Williamsia maris]|uniref:HD domain-containing protein n=1 Tax=Williamsia maris TaxID=72806 RepID=A0ABT1HJI4_9NOCA|nr:hypothetical protein [Williamsia maris]